jgi:hypothetical protein
MNYLEKDPLGERFQMTTFLKSVTVTETVPVIATTLSLSDLVYVAILVVAIASAISPALRKR